MLGALHRAVPDRIPAAYYGVSYVCSFQTVAEVGERAVLVEIEVGGGGAHPQGDGLSAHSHGMHNNANIPVEMIESELPLTVMQYALLPGTGGAGRYRGGEGWCGSGALIARRRCSPRIWNGSRAGRTGWRGGEPGSAGRLTLVRDGVATALPSKVGNVRLQRGDLVRLETSGGGGYGVGE